jgi:hypothetical protein
MSGPRRSLAALAAGWVLLGAIVLDLAGRAVARHSLIQIASGSRPGPWSMVVVAAVAAVIMALVGRQRRAPLLFAVFVVAGLAAQAQLGARAAERRLLLLRLLEVHCVRR